MRVDISLNWQATLPIPLALLESSQRDFASKELKRMAWMADQFTRPLFIEVYGMVETNTNEMVNAKAVDQEPESWDVLVRCEDEDPIHEVENLTFEEVRETVDRLMEMFPQAEVVYL